MSSVLKIVPPEVEELRRRKRVLTGLQRELSAKELELSTEKVQVNIFRVRYQEVVGKVSSDLDKVKAQVLFLASKVFPRAENFKEEADISRDNAKSFHEKNPESEKPSKEFNPSENLKKLFRRVAKQIHPDLASSIIERERRNHLMTRLNQAYECLDDKAIQCILEEWEMEQPTLNELTLGEQLVLVVEQISQIKKSLKNISNELERLTLTEMFQLKKKVESAELDGRDLLQEIADEIEEKIRKTKSRIRDLAHNLI